MTFQEEQDAFQKEIETNFISLFDLVQQITKEQNVSPNEGALFLLTRINQYLSTDNPKHFSYTLTTPPFEKYFLEPIEQSTLQDMLAFYSRNGRFKSERNAKSCGLLIEIINDILSVNPFQKSAKQDGQASKEQQGKDKKYHPSERDTHLQMIVILAEALAKAKGGRYLKSSGLPNNLHIAELLAIRAKEIEIEALTARSANTYRGRLTEITKLYKGV